MPTAPSSTCSSVYGRVTERAHVGQHGGWPCTRRADAASQRARAQAASVGIAVFGASDTPKAARGRDRVDQAVDVALGDGRGERVESVDQRLSRLERSSERLQQSVASAEQFAEVDHVLRVVARGGEPLRGDGGAAGGHRPQRPGQRRGGDDRLRVGRPVVGARCVQGSSIAGSAGAARGRGPRGRRRTQGRAPRTRRRRASAGRPGHRSRRCRRGSPRRRRGPRLQPRLGDRTRSRARPAGRAFRDERERVVGEGAPAWRTPSTAEFGIDGGAAAGASIAAEAREALPETYCSTDSREQRVRDRVERRGGSLRARP